MDTSSFINRDSQDVPSLDKRKSKSLEKGKNYQPRSRLLLIIDGILDRISQDRVRLDLFEEKILCEILTFFQWKYSSKIIYGLLHLKYSSYWELSKKLSIGNFNHVNKVLGDLEVVGIIQELKQIDDDYQIIKSFWKDEHKTASVFPKMFKLQNWFLPIAEAYSDLILDKYITKREFHMIKNRKDRYLQHLKIVKAQLKLNKEQEADAFGRCYNCNKLIRKEAKKGIDYHNFPIGLICNLCNTNHKEKWQEWIHSNK